ncbi:hypothetical protein [Flectobacillus major]|jgi:hypothetical protein|uniref:hypothetical protein n=1 Tax=Flectobacillus major TaxID=103 RepID=UPI0003FF5294|nr:hypothetical protein [Flectobacillus major]
MNPYLKYLAIVFSLFFLENCAPQRTVVVERRRPVRTVVVQQPQKVIVVKEKHRGKGWGRRHGKH